MPMMETCKKPWSGWVKTPRVSCFLKASGADGGNTPAWFLASSKRASGVHGDLRRGDLGVSFFF